MTRRGQAPPRPTPTRRRRRVAPWLAAWALVVAGALSLATLLHRGEEHASAVEDGRDQHGSVELRVSGPASIGSFAARLEQGRAGRVVTLDGVTYRDGEGAIGGVAVRDKDDGFVLTHAGESFRFKAKDESGYSVRDEAGNVRFRVKVKEDKFNVYDGTGKRIAYAKEKKGVLQLRDDGGATIGSISGTTDLALAAILVVPVPVEVRAAALAHGVEHLMP